MFAYKIVMVGDFGVGKTSLVKRFVENSFSEEYLSTIGVSISKKTLNDSTLMLWDIEGHTEFKAIFKQYLLGAKGFIIVADLNRKGTIDNIAKHLELCHSIVPNTPVSIALNKADLEHHITQETIDALYALSPNILTILKTSAKESQSVEELFKKLDSGIIKQMES
ncbi:MAG: Rab family GTPase [Sulfurimonas sp.]|nr:Rab family GTPase [Sulfurimonas sp.]